MPRFYIPPEEVRGAEVVITGSEAHHLLHVLRLSSGDELTLFDGTGAEYLARLVVVEPRRVVAQITRRIFRQVESHLNIFLIQALTQGHKMDFVVEKATELGVQGIAALRTARSRRMDDKWLATRRERWERIAVAAAKQCGRLHVPSIALWGWPELSQHGEEGALKLFLWEGERRRSLVEAVNQEGEWERVVLLVGPEGGFSPGEANQILSSGFIPVTLGPRILRAETASMAAITLIQARLGDMGGYAVGDKPV